MYKMPCRGYRPVYREGNMKRFYIHEIGRDYNSWIGHYYFAEEIVNENTTK